MVWEIWYRLLNLWVNIYWSASEHQHCWMMLLPYLHFLLFHFLPFLLFKNIFWKALVNIIDTVISTNKQANDPFNLSLALNHIISKNCINMFYYTYASFPLTILSSKWKMIPSNNADVPSQLKTQEYFGYVLWASLHHNSQSAASKPFIHSHVIDLIY